MGEEPIRTIGTHAHVETATETVGAWRFHCADCGRVSREFHHHLLDQIDLAQADLESVPCERPVPTE